MFKTIIAKTFHEALDVMFATARYRIGCKGFVTYKRTIGAPINLLLTMKLEFVRSAGEKRGGTRKARG